MRVHELAKKLGIETKSFIEKLNEIGIEGKTHLSGLDNEQVSAITNKLSNVVKEEKTNVAKQNVKIKDENKDHIVKEKLVFTHEKKENKQYDNRSNYNKENKSGYDKDNNKSVSGNTTNQNATTNFNNTNLNSTNSNNNNNSNNRNNYNKDNRNNNQGNYNRDNRNNSNNNNYNRSNTTNNSNYNNERRATEGNQVNSENKNRNTNQGGYNRDNRNNNNSSGFNKDRNTNQGGYNRDNRNTNQGGYNRDNRNDNRGNDNGNRFNKPFNRDQKKSDAPKTDSAIAPAVEKPTKVAPKNKVKFDKKKYELEKKQREEERKLKELRSDFRKDDKKKKIIKKKDKTIKNEITMLEGETIGTITIRDEISVKELAEKLGINVSDIIKKFFMEGKILTANAILTFEEAEEIAIEREVLVEHEEIDEVSYGEKYNLEQEDRDEELVTRAPVITIMGHVDHGKTSLLDAIRHTNVTEGEAGGITQKIGAYQIKWKGNRITFIDTPGHEAFTEMRARGAKVTDIAVLIVAADDGVKPQTVEAISHAKEAGVPIIVAINKIDKPGADVMRVKQELLEYGLMAPDWGGDTEFVEISAKQRTNLDSLLETIVLTSELLDLKANPKKRPKAVVIESRLDPQMGAVADILIQEGELKIGDIFVAGQSHGRVRSMVDDRGNKIEKAGLSKPVEITGFNNVPEAGDVLYGVNNDKQAKKIVEDFIKEKKVNEQNKKKHISLESLSQELEDQQLKELKCIIRGDSKGSVEALKESLAKLNNEKSMVNVIQATAGAITEGDVKLAEASDAIIIGFHVRPTTPARNEAEKLGVEIRTYNVIYHVIEDIEKAMKGMLDPEFKEIYLGRIEVRQVFKITNVGNIAGAIVVDGKVTKASKIRVLRDAIIIYEGEIESLKRFKDDVKEVFNGQECGIAIKDFNDIKEGDIIESYILEEIPR